MRLWSGLGKAMRPAARRSDRSLQGAGRHPVLKTGLSRNDAVGDAEEACALFAFSKGSLAPHVCCLLVPGGTPAPLGSRAEPLVK
jgi:hypothetical protein